MQVENGNRLNMHEHIYVTRDFLAKGTANALPQREGSSTGHAQTCTFCVRIALKNTNLMGFFRSTVRPTQHRFQKETSYSYMVSIFEL